MLRCSFQRRRGAPWPRDAALQAGKGSRTAAPWEPLEAARSCQHFGFNPGNCSWASGLQKFMRINLCCFKATKSVITCYSSHRNRTHQIAYTREQALQMVMIADEAELCFSGSNMRKNPRECVYSVDSAPQKGLRFCVSH